MWEIRIRWIKEKCEDWEIDTVLRDVDIIKSDVEMKSFAVFFFPPFEICTIKYYEQIVDDERSYFQDIILKHETNLWRK